MDIIRAVQIVRNWNRIRIFLEIRFGFDSRIHCKQISGFGIDNQIHSEDSIRIRFDTLHKIRDSIRNFESETRFDSKCWILKRDSKNPRTGSYYDWKRSNSNVKQYCINKSSLLDSILEFLVKYSTQTPKMLLAQP